MWQTKTFKTREEMTKWLDAREGTIQYEQVFIANGYGVEWRPLKVVLDYEDEEDEGED